MKAAIKELDGRTLTLEQARIQYEKMLYKEVNRFSKWGKFVGLEIEDLFSYANEGLIKAFNRFDTERGLRFSTYCVPMVEGEIKRGLRDFDSKIKVPRLTKEIANKIKMQSLEDETPEKIAEIIGCKEEAVEHALMALELRFTNLDAPVINKDGNEHTFSDMIGKEEDVTTVIVDDFINSIPEKLKLVIQLSMEGNTQEEVGRIIGVSQVQVSRYLKQIGERWKQYDKEEEKQMAVTANRIDEAIYMNLKREYIIRRRSSGRK
ncbi:sigma-70 family RNA polymerase sigma factor [Bacillus sp. 37MA]|uniref:sigma-70 family RNA polymerase sigma factor n=1 Tax=Bacillus sp. 37MA TaxID=1132442 RepID=UPI00035F0B86|nr:sigma-70 family RNA polymerase sigma factor [Bacillus sp. 37MA]